MATGGSHFMTKDFFKSVETPRRENEIKAMEMNKSQRIKGEKLRQDTELILVASAKGSQGEEASDDCTVGDDLGGRAEAAFF
jgi:hypothetical protein